MLCRIMKSMTRTQLVDYQNIWAESCLSTQQKIWACQRSTSQWNVSRMQVSNITSQAYRLWTRRNTGANAQVVSLQNEPEERERAGMEMVPPSFGLGELYLNAKTNFSSSLTSTQIFVIFEWPNNKEFGTCFFCTEF
ncbi:Protein of unknown function [Gryllus bimaculatus]|nr:Protein of unknown function [Gryllus bimaculatus]